MSKIGSTTKKAVALAAAATMTAGALPTTAFADENIPEENIVSGEIEPQETPETLPAQQPEVEPGEEEQEKKPEQGTSSQEEEPAVDEDEPVDKQEEGEPAAQSEKETEESDPQQDTGAMFTVSTDDELQAALASAESGQEIEVVADIAASPMVIDKSITLTSTNGSKISAKQSGTLFLVSSGTLSIDGIQVETKGNIGLRANRNASIVLGQGTSVSGGMYTVATVGGNITMESGSSVTSTSEAVLAQSGGTCTIDKGASVSGAKCGLSVLSGAYAYVYGTVEGTGDESFGIAGQGTANLGNITVQVYSSAKVSGGACGIYAPAVDSTLNVLGGDITGGWSGIELRGGSMSVSGSPAVKSTWAGAVTSVANNNGATVKGAAIAVSQHTTKDDISVDISGGTFEGACAFYETNPQGNEQAALDTIDISITGGTFTSPEGSPAIVSDDKDCFVSGGTFSSNPSTYLVENYSAPVNEDGTFGVKHASETAVASVETSDGTVSYYDGFSDAIAAASAGDKVSLLKDETLTEPVSIEKALTVDLGGNTLATTYRSVTLVLSADDVKFQNGKIDSTKSGNAAIRVNGGTVELDGIELDCGYRGIQVQKGSLTATSSELRSAYTKTDRYIVSVGSSAVPNAAAFSMVGSKIVNTAATPGSASNGGGIQAQYGAEVSIDADSSIDMSAGCGIQVFDDSKVTVNGVVRSVDDYGIANYGGTNGKTNPTIVLSGATVESSAADASGVYLPAPDGDTTIEDSTIIGFDGVNVRGGKVSISGSEISSTAAALKVPSQVGSGNVNIGAAVAIVPHTHHAPIDVSIESGTFSGPAALYETMVDDEEQDTGIAIEGGNFESTIEDGNAIVSDSCTGFITGGNYSSWTAAAYVPEGYALIDNGPVKGAPFVLGTESEMNDVAAGYLTTDDGKKAFFTDKSALDAAAAAAGVEATPTKRKVVFVDRDGNAIKEVEVDYGDGVPEDEVPQLPEDQLSYKDEQGRTHEFTGWSVSPESSFTENAEIAPTYGEKMVYSTIKFVDSVTGAPFGEVTSPDGYALDASLVPTPAPTIVHGGKTYKFTSWNEEPVGYHVDGDKTFTANYKLVGEPENPDEPNNPGDNGDDTGSDNAGTGSNNGSDGNRIENIKDDPTALCEQSDEQKLHQTGDEIPYAVGGGIIAALVAAAAVARRKFRE